MFKWLKNRGKKTVDFSKKVVGAENIQETAEEIKEMAQTVLSPKKQLEKAKTESFQDAKVRLRLTDTDIIQVYKNYVYCFYIALLFSGISFGFLLYNLFINKQIFTSFGILAVMALCVANCFKFSFRAFQIKHQKLCSVKEWYERVNEWLPPFSTIKK